VSKFKTQLRTKKIFKTQQKIQNTTERTEKVENPAETSQKKNQFLILGFSKNLEISRMRGMGFARSGFSLKFSIVLKTPNKTLSDRMLCHQWSQVTNLTAVSLRQMCLNENGAISITDPEYSAQTM
jgi:hypothetical protein